MTSTTAAARVAGRAGDNPAGPVALSPVVEAAQAALLARRAALGIASKSAAGLDQLDQVTTGPTAAERAQAALEARRVELGINYRPPVATVEGAATLEDDPAGGLDQLDWSARFDLWARQEAQRARSVKEEERTAKNAAWERWAARLAAAQVERAAAPVAPVAPRPAPTAAPVDLYAEGERLRLARLKEDNPRRFYLETLPELPDYVRAYPSLLAAARRGGRVPHMRLYLLCKALDPNGSGYVDLDRVQLYYTLKDSPYKAFGPRRLRQILAAGAGVFWERHTDNGLWLKSPDKIAAPLDVDHIAGAPVALPVWPLLDSHKEAAAAFYAAWHAARGDDPNPVSRGTIRRVTGACKSSQIAYEVLADVQARRNIAIVGDATKEGMQSAAWRFGHVFKFKDHAGKVDRRRRGWVYAAACIPSSYRSPYATLPKGRLRRINTSLHNLVTMGRGKCEDDFLRIYHGDGAAAADSYNRDPKHDHFYRYGNSLKPTAARPPKLEGVGLWAVLQGQS